jgi:cell division protein FtsI (penicillin-binding protein 3)
MANPRKRGTILLIVTGLVLMAIGARLVEIQAVRGETLATEALGQRMQVKEIPALRGTITDSDGEPFAVTVEARNLTADQTLVTDPAAVAASLGPILGVDPAVLVPRLAGDRKFVYLAKALTPEIWNRISELRLPGIFSETTSRRVYPAGDVAANVVGFVGAEGTGLGGLEYQYEDLLAGVAGEITYERGPGGRVIPTAASSVTEARPGVDVRLTIDRDIQYMAQKAIADQVRDSQSDSGTVVVMGPAPRQHPRDGHGSDLRRQRPRIRGSGAARQPRTERGVRARVYGQAHVDRRRGR